MNFEEFKQQLMEDLKEALSRRVGTEIVTEENAVQKLQQESYDGIVVRKENESIGVNMDATRLYSDLEQGKSYEDVLHYAVDIVQRGFEEAPTIDISQLTNYEAMKSTLSMQLIPIAGNEDMLAGIPHKEVEDLAIVYRFNVSMDEMGKGTILVKNDLLNRYGITAEQLHQDALISSPEIEAPSMKTLYEVTMELMGADFGDMMDELGAAMQDPNIPQVYVCTNESKVHGASVLMYPEFMDQAAEKIGGDFYVIPSSIHECLLYPANEVENYRDLEAMVREVNETQVAPKERLSDNVYHYDAKDKVFELAERYEERMADKERDSDRGEKTSVLKDLSDKAKEAAKREPKEPSVPKKGRAEETL